MLAAKMMFVRLLAKHNFGEGSCLSKPPGASFSRLDTDRESLLYTVKTIISSVLDNGWVTVGGSVS